MNYYIFFSFCILTCLANVHKQVDSSTSHFFNKPTNALEQHAHADYFILKLLKLKYMAWHDVQLF